MHTLTQMHTHTPAVHRQALFGRCHSSRPPVKCYVLDRVVSFSMDVRQVTSACLGLRLFYGLGLVLPSGCDTVRQYELGTLHELVILVESTNSVGIIYAYNICKVGS